MWQVGDAGSILKPTAREDAVILDTGLVQALMYTDDFSRALQVLSGPNYADVGACEDVMLEGNTLVLLSDYTLRKRNHSL